MKILLYSHDSYGLGHLRRTLTLAGAFVERNRDASALILTGSTVSDAFRLPWGVDIVKLPSAVKVANQVYESNRMSIGFETLRDLRSGLISSAAEAFEPDVFMVDKSPLGMKREVYPTLKYFRDSRPSTLTVLGLRDVLDDPRYVRRHWREGRIAEAIEEFYDLVLVYGPREVYDPLPEYGLSEEALDRSHYVGYIGRNPAPETDSYSPFRPGYVLVTAGGGGDGFRLIKIYLQSLKGPEPSFDSLVVTGPLMDDGAKREIEHLARGLRVRVMEFRPDMDRLIKWAGVVVSMGGYNTTVELLAARKSALIVPRVEPRVEQLIRAERLADLGLVEMIHPDDLAPGLVRSKVEKLLKRDPVPAPPVDVDLSGASRAVDLVTIRMAEKRKIALGVRGL
jgi:predicted glycosyltransferase